ncbi:MAG: UTP--glucose-1-phosphate uridylyltransferase [Clostridia bacterium]|nr:UTP--glucose-1-phosphate uridylyltransferase [Clostridia bacterium]
MKKVKKAVILVGGFGTRFLPATLCTPKELFPLVDKPILFYHLKECVDSGITHVCLVSSEEKHSINDLVNPNAKLIQRLKTQNKMALLDSYYSVMNKLKIKIVYQKEQNGTAGALACAQDWLNGDPFVLYYGDDLIEADVPAAKQIIDVYNQTGKSVCILQKVKKEDIHKYGSAVLQKIKGKDYYNMSAIVEKPKTEEAPSLYASIGRYVLTQEIFDELDNLQAINGEYYVTAAINNLAERGRMNATVVCGTYHDCGNKLEFAKTITEYMLKSEEFGQEYRKYIKNLAKKL